MHESTSRVVEKSTTEEPPGSGGEPQTVGQCTECGAIYPVQRNETDVFRPIGTDGTCRCGNVEFRSRSA